MTKSKGIRCGNRRQTGITDGNFSCRLRHEMTQKNTKDQDDICPSACREATYVPINI